MLQGFNKARRHLIQLARMIACEPGKKLSTFAGDSQKDFALVIVVGDSRQQAFVFASVDELNGAVVSQTETFCRVGDRYWRRSWRARHLQQELMLLRLQS